MKDLARICHVLAVATAAFGVTGCFVQGPTNLRLEQPEISWFDGRQPSTAVGPSTPAPTRRPLSVDADVTSDDVADEKTADVRPDEASVEAKAPPRQCPPEGTRVLLIGDSLSAGLGPAMQPIARACGTTFVHHGVVGSHVTQWQGYWLDQQLQRAEPTVVMMSMGGNDFQRTDPERVSPAIEKVVAKVEASGARFLWISPPTMPFDDLIDVRGMWADTLAAHPTSATYPTHELTIARVSDEVHPTPEGYRSLGTTLWIWMSNIDG